MRLRARRDLVISDSEFQGEASQIVKDPVGLKYFRLRAAEFRVLKMLDGTHSYSQITRQLQREFPDQVTRLTDVQQFVSSLHANGLLVSDGIGQAAPLLKRRQKEVKQKAMGLAASIICIRFPGVDPEPFLAWIYPKIAVFFSPLFTFLNLVLISMAGLLVLTNLTEFFHRLPEFQEFFGINNLLFLGVVLIFTKSIHELGHGLMCKHYGGECHEIGFMLMVLTPAMYCNTSDSWILPNKWHRIAIGAAGMYVELVLAALATFGWWFSHPGMLHYFCLNIMFLSSISTIVFNANPLLRYDGYYMLSDFLEIPNLAAKSKQSMISKLRVWCLGMEPINSPLLPQRRQVAFAFYSVASFVYRWFVMLMIFWFLKTVFEPYGLAVIGQLLIAISLIGMVVMPAFKAFKFFYQPGRLREVKTGRTLATAALLAVAAIGFFFFPVPHHVHCSFVVRPAEAQAVYVVQEGTLLDNAVVPGQQVKQGDVLAELENNDLQMNVVNLTGQLAKLKSMLALYQVSRKQLPDAGHMPSEIESTIRATERELSIRQKQLAMLTLVADRDGHIIPAPNRPAPPDDNMTLVSWTGTPLDRENRGAWLGRDTLCCYVGDPKKLKVELVVDQSDIKFLQVDQTVELVCQQYRNRMISGTLTGVSRDELSQVPRELSQSNGGTVAVTASPDGTEQPLIKSYLANASLNDVDSLTLLPGFHGEARIHVGSASLGSRLWRQIMTTVRFR